MPEGLSGLDAVSIPAAVGTASDALFNILGYGLPCAGLSGQDATNVPILIWGGASAVGSAAIQIAKFAGFAPIYTTASPENHESILEIGASFVFDYKSPSVVEDIKRAVVSSGKKLHVVFDAVSTGLAQLGSQSVVVAPNNSPGMARNCLSTTSSANELSLVSVLPVNHDSEWKLCMGVREHGSNAFIGPQDPNFPIRLRLFMDWFVGNHARFWQPSLRTTIVKGGEEGIEAIKRVARGDVSREKVLIAHPI